jgi:hypothetical protein
MKKRTKPEMIGRTIPKPQPKKRRRNKYRSLSEADVVEVNEAARRFGLSRGLRYNDRFID